jgi:twitching motility protein PilU
MEPVLEFADSGHLCLATLHANNATQALERIVTMFSREKHERLCLSLSHNIKAVISQILVPTVAGGRAVAMEMLLLTPRVSDLIARGKFGDLPDVLEKDTNSGMRTLDQSLYHLYCQGRISQETALAYAHSVSNMRLQIRLTASGTHQAVRRTSQSSNPKKPVVPARKPAS